MFDDIELEHGTSTRHALVMEDIHRQIGIQCCGLHADTMWEFVLLRRRIESSLIRHDLTRG